ncbi:hypothetical protein RDABS01_010070, partial [Bienertia sinuspersici]
YIDDIILIGINKAVIDDLENHLYAVFNIKDLGVLHYFLVWKPDIAFIVQTLWSLYTTSKASSCLGVQPILRYLSGTIAQGTILHATPQLSLQAYSDSN